jgi:hypothetical protein
MGQYQQPGSGPVREERAPEVQVFIDALAALSERDPDSEDGLTFERGRR